MELFSGEVLLHDPQDIAEHLATFELLSRSAVTGPACRAFLLGVSVAYSAEAQST